MKIILLLALAYGGYWFYNNQMGSELIGEWKIDVSHMMKIAYKKGITPAQEKAILKTLAQTSMTIKSNGELHMQFPDRGGHFDYSIASVMDSGCYALNISELGDSIACLKDNKLSLKNKKTGSTSYFQKI